MNLSRWILAAPWLIFGVGAGIYYQSENEVWAQFDRAQASWRSGDYTQAIVHYEKVYREYPNSSYAARALFELGTLNYVNSYNVNRAADAFKRLVGEYPDSPQAVDAYLMLGEINEIELQDLPEAINCWKKLLEMEIPSDRRRHLLFRIGNVYFKLDQFERANRTFEQLLVAGEDDDLAQQANIRLGTIYQLAGEYQKSLPYLRAVLQHEGRPHYRLQAQLGLIESFEFLDDLPAAIEVAQQIDTVDYPAEMKRDLLARLGAKQELSEPKPWNRGQH